VTEVAEARPSRAESPRAGRLAGLALVGLASGAMAVAVTMTVAGTAPASAGEPVGPEVLVAQAGDDGPQLPGGPPADPDRVRRQADEILARPEYQAPGQADRTIGDRVRDWIDGILPNIDGPGQGATQAFSYLVVGVVAVGALAALTYVLVSTRRAKRPPDEETDSDVDITPLRTPDEWTSEADRCERAGDHRGAVRARFRALTTTLARRDLVADTPGRTAGELRGDVAERAPSLAPAFAPVSDLFERIWFGADSATPADSHAARHLAERALEVAPRRPERSPSDPEPGPSAL